ncbi:gamma-glutamyltransferase [Salinithrix halophila]|uniref:Glutathione hydrolase proenzyme n=1 Tax=Salinithrix halophila TaxID=1485204 RepID=A0ABV8JHR1_9BACL
MRGWRAPFVWMTAIVLLFAVAVPSVGAGAQAGGPNPDDPRQVDVGKYGMVVSAHPLASKVGADVLKKGGNAVDAAVAIQFALNVAEPMMSGIGGGGFMMVYHGKNKKIDIVDSRERAPAGARPDMFLDENGKPIPFSQRHTHGNAIGVPGTLKGLDKALSRWGTRPMAQLIKPAIRMADQGVPVNWVLADAIEENKEKLAKTAAKDVFLPNGEPLKEGDRLVQKDLAHTFRLIQWHGTKAFYRGKIGKAIAAASREHGGSMKPRDLKKYRVTLDKPLRGSYKGYEVATMPPPSSGGITVLQILTMLDRLEIGKEDIRSPEKYHLWAEASRLAFADRAAYIGDPTFVDVPIKGMTNPDYLNKRSTLVNREQAATKVEPGDPWAYQTGNGQAAPQQKDDRTTGETTHFSVADRWGNLVSYTTTIEQLFGSGVMVPGYGIMLNNQLTDFDAVPGGPNEVQPGKRPMSSMSPTLLFKDGKPVMVVGSPGGPTIIASVAQTILNTVEYDQSLKEAIEEPRIYNSHTSRIRWEPGIPDTVRTNLQSKGHRFESSPRYIGNVNAIWIDRRTGLYHGAGDSTRESTAIGLWR